MLFGGVGSTRVDAQEQPLALDVGHYYVVVEAEGEAGPWRCHTVGYTYEIAELSGREVLAFHFHPTSGAVPFPHIHDRQHREPVDLSHVHIPSGRVSLEAVIRLAITELGVKPRRDDWESVIAESEQAWDRWRT